LKIDNSQIQKAEVFFKKYGSYALLLSWLPLLGDALVVSSGLLRLQFKIFSLLVFSGKFIRYLAFAYLAGLVV
jgi:membrane protein YqaA with SNARE-associated domain